MVQGRLYVLTWRFTGMTEELSIVVAPVTVFCRETRKKPLDTEFDILQVTAVVLASSSVQLFGAVSTGRELEKPLRPFR